MSRTSRQRSILIVATLALLATLPGLATQAAAEAPGSSPGTLVTADDFTGTAGPLDAGQIEVGVLSTRASTVTGGDALIGVRGLDAADDLSVTLNGMATDLAPTFIMEADEYNPGRMMAVGMVDGLREGPGNAVRVTAHNDADGTRVAVLPIDNHSAQGPVFSGPHQTPFVCRVGDIADYGLGLADGDPAPVDYGSRTGRPPTLDGTLCTFPTYHRWYYVANAGNPLEFDPVASFENERAEGLVVDWKPLLDPYGPYPADLSMTTTTEGDLVPAIARVETTPINRGITRVAILDDPAARGPEAPFETGGAWNGKTLYNWGASCGIGRQQGINTPNEVLSGGVDAGGEALDVGPEAMRPAVLQGYLVPHSSMTIFNTHCNSVLSAETMMMVKEHLAETYGRSEWVMGNGASGGAIQQHLTMNNYPGLQDGGLPLVSFPDVITTAMSPADCRLLRQYWNRVDGAQLPFQGQLEDGAGREVPAYPGSWSLDQRNAVSGHNFQGICEDWDNSFADLLVADRDCSRIPDHLRYSSTDPNRQDPKVHQRCTLQDNLVHYIGVDPETGWARRPVDNAGVQYGYRALLDGVISPEMFLDMNRHIGSYDDEGFGPWEPGLDPHAPEGDVQPRMSMDPDLAGDLYRYGFVTGRGAMDQAPIIDINLYADPVPILGFHDQARGYMMAERIQQTYGERSAHAIWSGAVLTNDAFSTMAEWLDGIEASRRAARGVSDDASWADEVASNRPLQADDSCVVTTAGNSPMPLAAPGLASAEGDGPCEMIFQVGGSPRIAAGGPTTEDIVKCQLTRPERADYPGISFTAAQWTDLTEIFAGGVCDWTVDGIGETERSDTWVSYGDADTPLGQPTLDPISNLVARSR